MLSRGAEVDTKPALEIDADNVKASHGATIGQIDPEHVFYLQTRGISRDQARAAARLWLCAGCGNASVKSIYSRCLDRRCPRCVEGSDGWRQMNRPMNNQTDELFRMSKAFALIFQFFAATSAASPWCIWTTPLRPAKLRQVIERMSRYYENEVSNGKHLRRSFSRRAGYRTLRARQRSCDGS